MAINIVTKEDLEQFRQDLIKDLIAHFNKNHKEPPKKYLKSYEVRELLGISRGTLQQLRINGTLSFTQVGGLMFYAYEDIEKLMKPGGKK
jgi:excisionase family DNA binding protein